MANRPAPALALRDGDREKLESWLRSRSVRSGWVKRARMILLAADGVGNREIAHRVAALPTTVIQWRARYEELGLAGLEDEERSDRASQAQSRGSREALGLLRWRFPSAVGLGVTYQMASGGIWPGAMLLGLANV